MPTAHETRTGTFADVAYDAFYTAGFGGSVVALFFFLFDALEGQPLFTPSLMGTVLFTDTPAEAVTAERLDMVAYYTAVHFAAFGALGLGISWLVHEIEIHSRHPAVLLLGLFLVFEVGFFAVASVLMPGVIARVGPARIAAANLLAAAAIAAFLISAHRPELWAKLRSFSSDTPGE